MYLREKINILTKFTLIHINIIPLIFNIQELRLVSNCVGLGCFGILATTGPFSSTLLLFMSGNILSITSYWYNIMWIKLSMNMSYLLGSLHYLYKLYNRNYELNELVKYNEYFTSLCFNFGNFLLVMDSIYYNDWIEFVGMYLVCQAFINIYLQEHLKFILTLLNY